MTSIAGEVHKAGVPSDGVWLRHVRSHEEFVECVELQAATWGAGFSESVPATILKISQRLGGVTAGAFNEEGRLLGFVFGITGLERGAIVHWSDMLAVRSELQNHGLGRRLKEFQREAVRKVGATRMYWTYDPLVARNAHFNLNRLRVRVAEYVRDMYGANTGSALHSGFGTDRFIVDWPIGPAEAEQAAHPVVESFGPDMRDAPVLNAGTSEGRDVDLSRFAARMLPIVRVEIPSDIFRIRAESTARAAHWRATTRLALQWALANGYSVERFDHDGDIGCGYYVLALTRSGAAPAGA